MMRSVLICHHDAELSLNGLAQWLRTWTDMGDCRSPALASGRADTTFLQGALRNAKKVVKVLGGDAWLALRRSLLARFGPRKFG